MIHIDRTIKSLSAAMLGVVLLGGCRLYKPYERPAEAEAVADSLFRPATATDTTSLAQLKWSTLFTDPLLQALIDTALCHNTDLATARLRVEAAEAQLRAAKLAFAPSVSASVEGGVKSLDGAKASKTYTLALSADWEIDAAGKLLNAKRGAQASLEAERAAQQAVQTQLVATVANSYYTLLMLDRQLDIARRTAQTWQDYLRTMQALKRAGQTTELAVAQTEASKLSTDATVVDLQRQISETENALTALMGITPGPVKRSTLEEQQFPETLTTGLPITLLSQRPDVREQEALLASAYYATNVARAAFYPSITLSGSAGWTNAAGAAISNPGQWLLQAVGSLVQPLFNRGQIKANLKVAEAQQQQALLAFRQSLLDAGADVNNALVQWQSARERIQLDSQQTTALQKALRSAELLMRYTSQNYLEVITARQSLLQAELNVAADRFDEIQGVINLYHALGGGQK